jgi:hypothetical protein
VFPDGRGGDRVTTRDGDRAAADDFSQVAPVETVSSSDGRGWRGLRAMRFRHTTGEIDVPPFSGHAIIVHLGRPVDVGERIGGRLREGHGHGRRGDGHAGGGTTGDLLGGGEKKG